VLYERSVSDEKSVGHKRQRALALLLHHFSCKCYYANTAILQNAAVLFCSFHFRCSFCCAALVFFVIGRGTYNIHLCFAMCAGKLDRALVPLHAKNYKALAPDGAYLAAVRYLKAPK
jgi:hypothetical protein